MLSRSYDWLYRVMKLFRVPVHWVFGTHPELAQLVDSGRIRRGRAIDLGCGAGREVIYLASEGFEVTGLDISPTAIGMAQKAADAVGADAEFVVDDVTQLTNVTGPFDLILDYGTLNDLSAVQRGAYMTQVLGLAAEDSQFVLMCFDNKLPLEEIRDLFGDGYEIETVASKGEIGTRRTITIYLIQQKRPLRTR